MQEADGILRALHSVANEQEPLEADRLAGVWCAAHLARTGRRVQATKVVNDEPMCSRCYSGAPIFPRERLNEGRGGPGHVWRREYVARKRTAFADP